MRKRWFLTQLALLGAALPLSAAAQPVPASLPLGPSPGQYAEGAARVVGSILAYSRWPRQPDPVRLCIVGPAAFAAKLIGPVLPGGVRIERREMTGAAAALGTACDAVYIGDLGLPAMRQVTENTRGAAVVTIAERDPTCRSEAMFCLLFGQGGLSFQMNIDAISRSAVRIDPRVLRLSRGY